MALSTYIRNKIWDAIFNNTSMIVAQAYASLHSADPGITGASEVTGGSYARQAISAAAASGGAIDSDAIIDFAGMPAVTVTHVGVWDAVSAGNFIEGSNALAPARTFLAGDIARIPIGSFDSSLT